jgi:hypothetical protein
MMRKCFLLVLVLIGTRAFAIRYPSVEQVATKLYGNYIVPDYESDTTVAYEKKRDGWHISRSAWSKASDKFVQLSNELFWSSASGKYQPLTMFRKGSTFQFMERVRRDKYVGGFYDFERCPYYGYEGWYADVITDFGNTIPTNDTLLEALARSYNAMASAYIGMQYGFEIPAQMNLPEKERLDLYITNSKKSISMYDILRKRNLHFQVLIGEVSTKYANEVMAHYDAMIRYKREKEFSEYFNEELYDPFTRGVAKAVLENCNTDGIIFTNGDNDTFPLWYLQWIKGVRKDVSVMNMSLMNVDYYLNRNRAGFNGAKAIPMTFPEEKYEKAEYFPIVNTDPAPANRTLFFDNITTDITMVPGDTNYVINNTKVELTNADDAYGKYELLSGRPKATISIQKRYLLQSDMAALDIICTNHDKRSIYFSSNTSAPSFLQSLLYQEGIIWRFLPDNSGMESTMYIAHASTKIAKQKLDPVLLIDTTCTDRVTGSYWTTYIRSATIALAQTMLKQKDTAAAVMMMDKMYERLPFTTWMPQAVDYYASEFYYAAGEMESGDRIANAIMNQIETDSKAWKGKSVLSEEENHDYVRAQTVLNIIENNARLHERRSVQNRAIELTNVLKKD